MRCEARQAHRYLTVRWNRKSRGFVIGSLDAMGNDEQLKSKAKRRLKRPPSSILKSALRGTLQPSENLSFHSELVANPSERITFLAHIVLLAYCHRPGLDGWQERLQIRERSHTLSTLSLNSKEHATVNCCKYQLSQSMLRFTSHIGIDGWPLFKEPASEGQVECDDHFEP